MDAFFIDIKEPWKILENVSSAVKPRGYLGFLVPATNQVSMILKHTKRNHLFVTDSVFVFKSNL